MAGALNGEGIARPKPETVEPAESKTSYRTLGIYRPDGETVSVLTISICCNKEPCRGYLMLTVMFW